MSLRGAGPRWSTSTRADREAPITARLSSASSRDAAQGQVDVVVCARLDRLGRTLRHLVALLDGLQVIGRGVRQRVRGDRRDDTRGPGAAPCPRRAGGVRARADRGNGRGRVGQSPHAARDSAAHRRLSQRRCWRRCAGCRSERRPGGWACRRRLPTGGCVSHPVREHSGRRTATGSRVFSSSSPHTPDSREAVRPHEGTPMTDLIIVLGLPALWCLGYVLWFHFVRPR